MATKRKGNSEEKVNHNKNGNINGIKLPNKIFKPRESLLTELFKDKNMKTAYNAWPGIFISTMLYSILKNYQQDGRLYFDTRIIRIAFLQFDVALMIWICMFVSNLSVYFVFLFWAHVRKTISHKFYWDRTFVLICFLYVFGLSYCPASMIVSNGLGVASSLAIMLEMTRFQMKFYAFVRSNCPKFLEANQAEPPSLSHYLYFSFAPTLVYKDVYPRSNSIRWYFVFTYFVEVVQIILVFNVMFENTYMHDLKDYGIKKYTSMDIFVIIVRHSFVALSVYTMFQFACHNYMNGAAELLRFSDRQFYKDWWTAKGVDEFLRKWNTFIYDWLFVYVYKDCYEQLPLGRKDRARLVVLLLSAFFHDMIMCVTCRHYLPVMTITYVLIILFRTLLKSNKLILLFIGIYVSGMFTLYTAECYARINCPLDSETNWDIIKPRLFYC